MSEAQTNDHRRRRGRALFRLAAGMVEPERQVPPAAQVQSGAPRLYPRPGGAPISAATRARRKPFEGLRILDIGCGGGLLCEPMARLGADVVGADASATNIEVAKLHAAESGVKIDYRATTAEALADAGEKFDVILNMEVVEHVADVDLFVAKCAADGEARRHRCSSPPSTAR